MTNTRKKAVLGYLDILHQLAIDEMIPTAIWEMDDDAVEELETIMGDLREEIK